MALWSENNHGFHTKWSFQTKVLKTGHFTEPFGMKDFEGHKEQPLFLPMVHCVGLICGKHNTRWYRGAFHITLVLFCFSGSLHPSFQSSHTGG